MKTLDVR